MARRLARWILARCFAAFNRANRSLSLNLRLCIFLFIFRTLLTKTIFAFLANLRRFMFPSRFKRRTRTTTRTTFLFKTFSSRIRFIILSFSFLVFATRCCFLLVRLTLLLTALICFIRFRCLAFRERPLTPAKKTWASLFMAFDQINVLVTSYQSLTLSKDHVPYV